MTPPPLTEVILMAGRIEDPSRYPFDVPVIRTLDRLVFTRRVTMFVGENGSGKSTLLEAIALAAGFGPEGGTPNFSPRTTDRARTAAPLADALRLSWTKRLRQGFFLRAESMFNVATEVDALGMAGSYGGQSLHDQSHGESFLALVEHRFSPGGLFLLDEPESAVSPQRQLTLLSMLHALVTASPHTQIVIATHAPILLAYPDAQILSFDGEALAEIPWGECAPVQILRGFLERPQWWLDRILGAE